jgi:hypothetical protein
VTDSPVIHRQLSPEVRGFLRDLLADPKLASYGVTLERAFAEIDLAGDSDPIACGLMAVIEWIAKQPPGGREKLDVIFKLAGSRGKVSEAFKG